MFPKVIIGLIVFIVFELVSQQGGGSATPSLVNSFKFSMSAVSGLDDEEQATYIRPVTKELQHMDGWISSVGSGVAAIDLKQRGRYDEICLVDPRNNSVSVQEFTGSRFEKLFTLLGREDFSQSAVGIAPMGCLPGDFNQDGSTDILVYYWGKAPTLHIRNPSRALNVDAFQTQELFADEVWYTNAATASDLNGDGNLDLVFGNYFCGDSRLLQARSHLEEFQDVSDSSVLDKLTEVTCNSTSPMHRSMAYAKNGGSNRLLVWTSADDSSVNFSDQSHAIDEELRTRWTLAVAAGDLNGDLLPELYFANDFGPDVLMVNTSVGGSDSLSFVHINGQRSLLDSKSKVLGKDSFKGMGVDFSDIEHSGQYSIAVSNISAKFALFESHFLFMPGEKTLFDLEKKTTSYKDESVQRGVWTSNWAWDLKFADFNNDGNQELIQTIGFLRDMDPSHGGKNVNMWAQLHEVAMGMDELLPYSAFWAKFSINSELSGNDHDRFYTKIKSGSDSWKYVDISTQIGMQDKTVSRGVALSDFDDDGKVDAVISRQWMDSTLLLNQSDNQNSYLALDLVFPTNNGGMRPAVGATALLKLPNDEQIRSFVDGGNGHSGVRSPILHFGLGTLASPSEMFEIEISWRDRSGVHSYQLELPQGKHTLQLDQLGVTQL